MELSKKYIDELEQIVFDKINRPVNTKLIANVAVVTGLCTAVVTAVTVALMLKRKK